MPPSLDLRIMPTSLQVDAPRLPILAEITCMPRDPLSAWLFGIRRHSRASSRCPFSLESHVRETQRCCNPTPLGPPFSILARPCTPQLGPSPPKKKEENNTRNRISTVTTRQKKTVTDR
eukprot:1804953-Rhodomonas_salina.1